MQLRYEQLHSHLQKSLSPLYLISGDVPLLVQEARTAIWQKAQQQGFSDRQIFQVETGFSWQELLAKSSTISLFASKQVFELRFAPNQLGDAGSKALKAYAERVPKDKILLITTPKLDAQQQKVSWFQALLKVGVFIPIWPIPIEQLPQWITQRLAAVGLKADRESIQLLATYAEGNLLACAQEIEKLRLLYGTSTPSLTTEMIAEAITNNARYDIFQLVDSALQGDVPRTLRILSGVRAEGIEPILVLWALARELRVLENLRHLIDQGMPLDQALSHQHVWEKRKPLLRKALQQLSSTKLRRHLQHAARMDCMIKGAEVGNVWNELERLTLALTQ